MSYRVRTTTHPNWILRLAIALLIGVVAALAVSVAGAIGPMTPGPSATVRLREASSLRVASYRNWGLSAYEWRVETGGYLYPYSSLTLADPLPGFVPPWSRIAERRLAQANDPVLVICTGWPVRAFRAELQTERYVQSEYEARMGLSPSSPHDVFEVRDGISMTDASWQSLDQRGAHRIIPLAPIGAGLGIDTAVYATIPALAFVVLPAWRRTKRSRRGCCPECGGDLAGDEAVKKCPGCGSGVTVGGAGAR